MPKSGQARVPTADQQRILFEAIRRHRHPEKNIAIMQLSLSYSQIWCTAFLA